MRQQTRKVFAIGMFKTGTTTFGEAMRLLGYRPRCRFIPLLDNLSGYFDLDPAQFTPFEDEIRQEARRFDAFADSPWLYLYRELDRWYPNSLFVLTLRKEAATVAQSDLAWWHRNGLMARWLREVGKPPSPEMFIERYERHNENVRRYFRDKPQQLLEVCWETEPSPWKVLCDFVGATIPNEPFPHANRSPRRRRESEPARNATSTGEDITVVMPSCNRRALFEETLRCLLPHVLRHRMRVLIGENCLFTEELRDRTAAIAAEYPMARIELVDLTKEDRTTDPWRRMLRSVDRLYALVETPFIFHCEDDWWLSDEDFISPSKAILEQFPAVKIVRLTGRTRQPFPENGSKRTICYGDGSSAAFHYSRYGGPGGRFGAFTFNPGLRRKSDYLEHFGSYERFGKEFAISSHAQRLGHREAILDGVYARHLGEGQSRIRNPV